MSFWRFTSSNDTVYRYFIQAETEPWLPAKEDRNHFRGWVLRGRARLSGARIASMNAQRGISKSRFLKEF